jgi:hypothetical protein
MRATGSTIRIIISLMLILSASAYSQENALKDRLKRMRSEYSTSESLHVKMTIKVYEHEQSPRPYYNEVADIKKASRNYTYVFGSTVMLMNSKYLVMVDKLAREIVCSKRSPKSEDKIFEDATFDLDSILSLYGEPELISKEDDTEHYRVNQSKGPIKKIDLIFSTTANVVKRIIYRYEDRHYVVIDFDLFDPAPGFDGKTFDEGQYFVVHQGKYKGVGEFAGYQVGEVNAQNK